jgi:hypothetical protein
MREFSQLLTEQELLVPAVTLKEEDNRTYSDLGGHQVRIPLGSFVVGAEEVGRHRLCALITGLAVQPRDCSQVDGQTAPLPLLMARSGGTFRDRSSWNPLQRPASSV